MEAIRYFLAYIDLCSGAKPVSATFYSLFVIGATSLVDAFNDYRMGLVSIKTTLLFGLTSVRTF